MREIRGNLWDFKRDNALAVTTNGTVRRDGWAVMGRGCAREAADRYPGLQEVLGREIEEKGNHVFEFFMLDGLTLFTFPVKHRWHEPADLDLIERSARELVEIFDGRDRGMHSCVLPRPGCGNGMLEWEFVKPRIEGILDDRFSVITW